MVEGENLFRLKLVEPPIDRQEEPQKTDIHGNPDDPRVGHGL